MMIVTSITTQQTNTVLYQDRPVILGLGLNVLRSYALLGLE